MKNIVKSETLEMLEEMVLEIADHIKNGILLTEDNIHEYDCENFDLDIGDYLTAQCYFEDLLDIKYTINYNKEYCGALVTVAIGGPNIYINTNEKQVEGYWGSDEFIVPYSDDTLGVDDYFEEIYNY